MTQHNTHNTQHNTHNAPAHDTTQYNIMAPYTGPQYNIMAQYPTSRAV